MRSSALVLFALLAACASADRPGGGNAPAAGPRPAPSERSETLRGFWVLYLSDDPAWPAAKGQWLAMGRGEAWILVENLLASIVRSSDRGDARSLARARSELASMPDVSVPYLVEALDRGDNVTRRHVADVLVAMGQASSAALVERLGSYGLEARVAALSALGSIGDPTSVPALFAAATGDAEWSARAEAAEALAAFLPSPEAERALARVLGRDADAFVRRKAAEGLARGSSDESAAALKTALDDADAAVRARASDSLASRRSRRP